MKKRRGGFVLWHPEIALSFSMSQSDSQILEKFRAKLTAKFNEIAVPRLVRVMRFEKSTAAARVNKSSLCALLAG